MPVCARRSIWATMSVSAYVTWHSTPLGSDVDTVNFAPEVASVNIVSGSATLRAGGGMHANVARLNGVPCAASEFRLDRTPAVGMREAKGCGSARRQIRAAPLEDPDDSRGEVATHLCEPVLEASALPRHLVRNSRQYAGLGELPQPGCGHRFRDFDAVREVVEARRAVERFTDDQHRRPGADDLERSRDGAVVTDAPRRPVG